MVTPGALLKSRSSVASVAGCVASFTGSVGADFGVPQKSSHPLALVCTARPNEPVLSEPDNVIVPKNGFIEIQLDRGGAPTVAGVDAVKLSKTVGRVFSGAAADVGAPPPGNDLVKLEDPSKSTVVVDPHTGSPGSATSARLTEYQFGVGARAFAGRGVASLEDTRSAEFNQGHVPPSVEFQLNFPLRILCRDTELNVVDQLAAGVTGAAKVQAGRTVVGRRSSAAADDARRTKRGTSKKYIGECGGLFNFFQCIIYPMVTI